MLPIPPVKYIEVALLVAGHTRGILKMECAGFRHHSMKPALRKSAHTRQADDCVAKDGKRK
ncbi:MAG: hypothetical protein NVSMB22_23950 [Chloroflexota bacterium]